MVRRASRLTVSLFALGAIGVTAMGMRAYYAPQEYQPQVALPIVTASPEQVQPSFNDAHPEFRIPTQAEYRSAYKAITATFTQRRDAMGKDAKGQWVATSKDNLVSFAMMLADSWNNSHQTPDTKSLDQLWEVPVTNDWLGCLFVNFPDLEQQVDASRFVTYNDKPALFVWLGANAKTAPPDFIARLNQLPDWAPRCEAIVRQDDGSGSSI